MPKTMEQLTAAHTGKVLQELRNLIINFKNEGREVGSGIEEFLEYMENINLQRRKIVYIPKKECPECLGEMVIYPGDDNDSHWICPNCRFSIYNSKSIKEVITEEMKNG